jgi:hypothetical protein
MPQLDFICYAVSPKSELNGRARTSKVCLALVLPLTITLMDGEQANLVFTDLPCNVRIDGNVSGLGAVRHRAFAMASGEMSLAEFTNFQFKHLSRRVW